MTAEELLSKLIDKQHSYSAIRTIGEGIAINVTEAVCDIKRDGAPLLHDARLHAIEDIGTNKFTIVPKEGSRVLYGIIDNQPTESVILSCSEVAKVFIKIGSTEYVMNEDGYLIKRDGETLQQIISDLITEVQKIIVINGTTPNVGTLETINKRVKKVLQ